MHFKNGRPAQNGDKVVYFGWGGPVVGILYDAVPGNDCCNGKLAPIAPSDSCPNLAECLHLDDVLGSLPHIEGKPEQGVTYCSPSQFLNLASVPNTNPPADPVPPPEALARKAYGAYGASTGGKNFRGDPMPEFDDLPEAIRAAWDAAARAVHS